MTYGQWLGENRENIKDRIRQEIEQQKARSDYFCPPKERAASVEDYKKLIEIENDKEIARRKQKKEDQFKNEWLDQFYGDKPKKRKRAKITDKTRIKALEMKIEMMEKEGRVITSRDAVLPYPDDALKRIRIIAELRNQNERLQQKLNAISALVDKGLG